MKTRRRYRRKSISKRRKRKSTKKKRRYRRKGTKKKKRRRRRRGGEPKRTLKRTQQRRGPSGFRGFVDPKEVDREMEKVVRNFPQGIGQQRHFAPELYKKTMGDARDTAISHLVKEK